MLVKVFGDRVTLGQSAAEQAAAAIRRAIAERGQALIIAATAASQLEFLDALTKTPGIDWSKAEAFHLDEYIGLPVTHPGSFRKMLLEQLVRKTGITQYHLLDGDSADPSEVVGRVGKQLASTPVDIAFLGIGENGHIAFNDPPADFETEEPYIIVTWMKPAGNSRWARPGSPIFPRYPNGRFRCRRARFSRLAKYWRWCPAPARRKR